MPPAPSDPALPDDGDDRSPRLNWSEDGAPRSGRFGDVYFSKDDGLAESRAVFLAGCGLPQGWAGRSHFTVGELGFGTGLNIVALLDLWRREGPPGARLNVFTVEGFPLTRDQAARALSAWPDQADITAALLDAWPDPTPGFHRIDLPDWNAVIDLAVGDVAWALSQWTGRADAWFLDGFSPALNPDMWSEAVLAGVAARSAPDARLATFTVAGAVRRGLEAQGFTVERLPGHGRKRQRLEARRTPDAHPTPRPATPDRVAVIGAGIAGASVARALLDKEISVTVIEVDRPGAGGSGFPAALVTPRMDAGDAVIAGLYAQALETAGRLYAATPDAVIAHGVLQLEQADRDAARFARIAAQPIWPDGAMTPLDAAAASDHLDQPVMTGGLRMDQALTVRPCAVLDAWLNGAERITSRVAALDQTAEGWRLLDADGVLIATADAVVLTAGWGTAELAPALNLAPVRGQADWVEGVESPATAWGGYLAPTGSGLLYGATHDRGDQDVAVRPEDTARNRDQLRTRFPDLADRIAGAPGQARAAVRATTRDRLPVCGPLDQPGLGASGLWVMGGLGSRGFCVAPLLGEHLAAAITDRPSPLPADIIHRLRPDRLS